MKKRIAKKKLSINKETLANLEKVVGGLYQAAQGDVVTDTDGDTFPSGGGDICWISDCNACPSQIC
ncbi:MAG: hypothetical protein ACJ75H_05560 [Thermoanaerobaculia bacterium]